jgi:uracil-DNA glycosylase family 4
MRDTDRQPLEALAKEINRCRQRQGCGHPPCGRHAVGKPTHQLGLHRAILVVGEAPAADGWWRTGRAFYRKPSPGGLELSRTGVNLNRCLAVLGTNIECVSFVEAIRCRPSGQEAWRPGECVRQRCSRFLLDHLLVTQPRPVLPLGLIATASCLEVTVGGRAGNLDAVVGVAAEWVAPWGPCWILPLYHPSPANGGRWPRNERFLREFLEAHPAVSGVRRRGYRGKGFRPDA